MKKKKTTKSSSKEIKPELKYGDYQDLSQTKLIKTHDHLKNYIADKLSIKDRNFLWELLECEREITLREEDPR